MKQSILFIFLLLHGIFVLGNISLNITSVNPSCPATYGTITVKAIGGTAPYTFSLNGKKQNNGYFTQLFAGTYTVAATDANGQSATSTVILNSLDVVMNSFFSTYTSPSSCLAADGSVTLIVSGGIPPYTYSIDQANYQTSNTFLGLTEGYYDFYIKDAKGCIATWSVFSLHARGCFTNGYGTANSNAVCGKKGAIHTSTAPYGTAPYQYSLDRVNWQGTGTFTNLDPGLYHVYTRDSLGATRVAAMQIYALCFFSLTYTSTDASCQQSNGSVTLMGTNGTPPYTYTMDGINYQTGNVFTGLAAGDYAFSVMDAIGLYSSATVTVTDKCPIIATTAKTDDICGKGNGSITVHGSNGTRPYLFSRDGANFQSDSVFTGLAAGNYTVTLKDAGGFVYATTVAVAKNCLQITATPTNETCSGKNGAVTVTASNGTAPYQFSIDGINFQTGNVFTGLAAGNYTVTVRDANLLANTATTNISNTLPPTVNLGNDTTLCSGQTLALSLNISNAAYIWQDGSTGNSFTVSKAGKYWATATANGCKGSDTINVSYLSLGKLFTTSDTTACIGNTIMLDAGHAGATFLWDDNSSKQTRTVSTNAKYWVKVSSGGCSASDTITAHFVAGPVIVFPSDTSFCNTQQLILNAGNINATYLWNDGTIGSTLVVKKAGTYIVAATANGCTTYDTIKVAIKPNPQIALGNDTTLCAGQMVTLNATDKNVNNNATYFWQDGSKLPLYTVNKQGSYLVKVTANGCDTTGKISVIYTTKPVVDLGLDTTLCNTNQLVLDASYTRSSYLWQDGSSKPSFIVAQAGVYKVNVTNYCGTISDSITVQYENCECKFFIPSAFSPNGDGKNDVFKPSYKCFFANYKLTIYNRFGKVIFKSSNADSGWDGLINGMQQPAGVYVWEMSYLDSMTGKMIKKTGTMVLVK